MKTLTHIGFGNMVNSDKMIAVLQPDSAPVKRIVQHGKEQGIAFFRTKDALGIELYRFVGVFHLDTDATRKKGKCIWHRESNIYEL